MLMLKPALFWFPVWNLTSLSFLLILVSYMTWNCSSSWTVCMDFQDLLAQNGSFGGKIWEGVVRYWPQRTRSSFWRLLPPCHLVKIDQEIRLWECRQADRHTDRHMLWQRQTEFIICPMLYAIAMSYGAHNKSQKPQQLPRDLHNALCQLKSCYIVSAWGTLSATAAFIRLPALFCIHVSLQEAQLLHKSMQSSVSSTCNTHGSPLRVIHIAATKLNLSELVLDMLKIMNCYYSSVHILLIHLHWATLFVVIPSEFHKILGVGKRES